MFDVAHGQSQSIRTLFAVVQGDLSPGPRYRIFQYLRHLERAGISATVLRMQGDSSTERSIRSAHFGPLRRAAHYLVMWMESLIVQVRLVLLAPRFDRIVLYRLPLWAVTRWLLAPYRPRILTDFDDALDTIDRSGPGPVHAMNRWVLRRGLQNAILASTTTITSNAHNSGIVERLSRQVAIIPTSIDMSRIPFRDRSAPLEDRLVVGWIGTPSTAEYLVEIEEALRHVQQMRPIVIRLIGAGQNPFRTIDAEVVHWSFADEPSALTRMDIGLMPMPDTPWTRGKAATKALQYNASGAPAISSRTATNLAILGDQDGSLFATTREEWIGALFALIDHPELRSEVGRRGHERVRRHFSVESNAPKLVSLIRNPAQPPSDTGQP